MDRKAHALLERTRKKLQAEQGEEGGTEDGPVGAGRGLGRNDSTVF